MFNISPFIDNNFQNKELVNGRLWVCLAVLCVGLLPFGRSAEIPTAILAIIGLLFLLKEETQDVLKEPAVQLFGLIFLLLWLPMAFSLYQSVDIERSLKTLLLYMRFLFLGVAIIVIFKNAKLKRQVLKWISLAVFFWLADSIFQLLSGVDILGITYSGGRLSGPFNKLIMPVYMSVLLPFVLLYIARHYHLAVFIIAMITVLCVLLLSGSRASFVVLGFGLSLFCYYCLRRGVKNFAPIMFGFVVLFLTVGAIGVNVHSGIKQRVDATLNIVSNDYDEVNKATSYRLTIWHSAWDMSLDNLVTGVGVRNFRQKFHQYEAADSPFRQRQVTHPHLFILETFAEMGLVGVFAAALVPFILLFFIAHQKVVLNYEAAISLISVMMVFFPLNTHVSLYGSTYSQLAWFVVAMSCACLLPAKQPRGHLI